MRNPVLLLLLATTTAAAGGCSTFDAPTAQIAGVTMTTRTADAVTLSFALNLTNPNDEPLELHEMFYTLRVGDRVVYDGRRSPQATLASGSTRQIQIPAVVNSAGVPTTADGALSYRLTGHLGYLTPDRLSRVLRDLHLRRPKVRFDTAGVVELPADQ